MLWMLTAVNAGATLIYCVDCVGRLIAGELRSAPYDPVARLVAYAALTLACVVFLVIDRRVRP